MAARGGADAAQEAVDMEKVADEAADSEQDAMIEQVENEAEAFTKGLDMLKSNLKGMKDFVDSQQASGSAAR